MVVIEKLNASLFRKVKISLLTISVIHVPVENYVNDLIHRGKYEINLFLRSFFLHFQELFLRLLSLILSAGKNLIQVIHAVLIRGEEFTVIPLQVLKD